MEESACKGRTVDGKDSRDANSAPLVGGRAGGTGHFTADLSARLYQYKVERALALYRDGVGSLGYVAEQLGLSKRDLIREARARGVDPDYSEETVQEEPLNH